MNYLAFIFLIILTASCVSVPKNTHSVSERITTGPGAEDILIDTISCRYPRLLVSCADRRAKDSVPNGAIYAIDLEKDSLTSYPLIRTNEPDSLFFHPHGFDLIRQKGKVYLFVVSHDDKKKKHYIYKYEVNPTSLKFVAAYENPLLSSPNSVAALKNGGFYTSIDQGRRGNQMDMYFKAKTGSLVFCNEQGSWARVANKLAYPNGLHITAKERYLYTATSRQQSIFKYNIKADGNLINREKVSQLAGGDNIRLGENKELLIPAHPKIVKFFNHTKDSTKLSPSIVYSLNPANGIKEIIYANDGGQISAPTTCVSYKGYLYIGQVYQAYILRVKRKNEVAKK